MESNATFSTAEPFWRSRLGVHDVGGKHRVGGDGDVSFEDGKIPEEWVSNDELGQLLQLGTLEFSVKN